MGGLHKFIPGTHEKQNKTENWEDDIEYPSEIHGAMRHEVPQEQRSPNHGEGPISDIYQGTEYKEDAITHDKSPVVKNAPEKVHWIRRLRNDNQLLILLGLVVIVIVLSFFIFFRA